MDSARTEILEAVRILRGGGLVVFPTETVYGLGADATNEGAVRRIYAAKGRPGDNPLIVHLASLDQLTLVARDVLPFALELLHEFSPGPLTMVLPARDDLPRTVTGGLETVAVRLPAHPVAMELLSACRLPIAAPSANRSGQPSPTTVDMARDSLGAAAGIYLDGGPCAVGLESTVATVRGDTVTILRPGAITEEDFLSVRPTARVVSPAGGRTPSDRLSPGTRHRHYQPKAAVLAWGTDSEKRRILENLPSNAKIGLIQPATREPHTRQTGDSSSPGSSNAGALPRGGRSSGATSETRPVSLVWRYENLQAYARSLYIWFHEADHAGVSHLLVHLPSEGGIGIALRDRILRAGDAHGSITPARMATRTSSATE